MPRYDGTGPRGKGPRTGRGMGYCKPGKKVGRPRIARRRRGSK